MTKSSVLTKIADLRAAGFPDQEINLDRRESAEYLQIRPNTLAAWKTNHRYKLRYFRIGKRAMYRLADLNQFIQSRTVEGV